MKYTNVNIKFLNEGEFPHIEEKIRKACDFLETMVNSQMFKDFVLEGNYVEKLSNKELYDRFLEKDIEMVFQVKDYRMGSARPYSVNTDTHIVSAYIPDMKDLSIPRTAAILAHEYGHIIDFHHHEKWASTFSFYVQYEGEKLFNKFYKKLKNKEYPRKGKWLVYEPVWIFWFWKRLKWVNVFGKV